ncbi:MAG: YbaN family protein [Bacteroidales bacterium]
MPRVSQQAKRIICAILGTISLGLGILGMILPLLPTTPFLLLTAFLYAHSYPRLHERLMQNRVTGPIITDFKVHRAIALHKKVFILTLLWATMIINAIFFVEPIWLKILLMLIAVGVTIHILSYRTRR